jgi:hypothetical protein
MSSTLFDISDPSNPFPRIDNQYIGDTSFAIGIKEFTLNPYGVFFTDTVGTGLNIWAGQFLTAHSQQLAIYRGTAYLLRRIVSTGNRLFCQRASDSVNELDVDGFSDSGYFEPKLYTTIPLTDPQDVIAAKGVLFVLDGTAGLKIFDLSDPKHPLLVTQIPAVQGYHLQVSQQSTLLVYTASGIIQFDISNPKNPVQLSKIS